MGQPLRIGGHKLVLRMLTLLEILNLNCTVGGQNSTDFTCEKYRVRWSHSSIMDNLDVRLLGEYSTSAENDCYGKISTSKLMSRNSTSADYLEDAALLTTNPGNLSGTSSGGTDVLSTSTASYLDTEGDELHTYEKFEGLAVLPKESWDDSSSRRNGRGCLGSPLYGLKYQQGFSLEKELADRFDCDTKVGDDPLEKLVPVIRNSLPSQIKEQLLELWIALSWPYTATEALLEVGKNIWDRAGLYRQRMHTFTLCYLLHMGIV